MKELSAPKRLKICEGDVFAYKIDERFRYVRVIDTAMPSQSYQGFAIAYFYVASSLNAQEIPELSPRELLIGPVIVHPSMFNDGDFLRVASKPVLASDLRQHCFRKQYHGFDPTSQADSWGLVDAAGHEVSSCQEPYEEFNIPSLSALEIRLGKSLGLIGSWQDWDTLPLRPRPLFRASREGKGPSRLVSIVIPDFVGSGYVDYRSKLESVERHLRKLPGFKEVAGREHLFFNWIQDGIGFINLAVKKKQHTAFFLLVEEGMRQLGIEKYWIMDNDLGDWLAGSFKPNHNPYRI